MITRSGSCGIVCIFGKQGIPIIPGAFLIRFRLHTNVNPDFIRLVMMTPTIQSCVETIAAGGVQKNLSGTNLRKLMLPLPTLDEQNQIVFQIKSISESEEFSQTGLSHVEQLKQGLMQDLLTGHVRVDVPI